LSTTDGFIKNIDKKIAELLKTNKPLLIAVKSVTALQSKRIFLDGKNKNGNDIGDYSPNEIRVNPKNSPKKFTPRGKNGKTKKKNKEPYKTGYFANYLEFKKEIGGNEKINTVDLLLFGELNRDWANAKVITKGSIATPKEKQISVNEYVIDLKDVNLKKVKRYGVDTVFGLSKEERKQFYIVLNFELKKALT
jgi:hypothetical protein